jgi:hypothetical protein
METEDIVEIYGDCDEEQKAHLKRMAEVFDLFESWVFTAAKRAETGKETFDQIHEFARELNLLFFQAAKLNIPQELLFFTPDWNLDGS